MIAALFNGFSRTSRMENPTQPRFSPSWWRPWRTTSARPSPTQSKSESFSMTRKLFVLESIDSELQAVASGLTRPQGTLIAFP
jgi:hypothetical protein